MFRIDSLCIAYSKLSSAKSLFSLYSVTNDSVTLNCHSKCLFCFENLLVNGESENRTFEIKNVLNRSSFEESFVLTPLPKYARDVFPKASRTALCCICTLSNSNCFVIAVVILPDRYY